ncbi:MAG: hypothetical protein R2798_04260 [Chitinophagales bacterium]|nr:hypothetical protein [Bacteroidota bacterium]
MKPNLDSLKHLKKVGAPEYLWEKIQGRIQQKKQPIIPLFWVEIAAATIVTIIGIEVYLFSPQSTASAEQYAEIAFIQQPNNMLYNE